MTKKISGNVKVSVSKRKPIKAGSTHKGNTGGILNAKVVKIVKKK